MPLRFFLIIPLLCLYITANSAENSIELSDESHISLLTCSPGEDLYSVFGHSAIRVVDPLLPIDIVFNYGTFDFSAPNFYTNFVKGKLNYILSVSSYRNFEYTYVLEGRRVDEQILRITLQERQLLLDSLLINYKPENRAYLYDFFLDNCATRIRDIFDERLPRDIVYDYTPFDHGKSFRDLITPYLLHLPWTRLGINLALGLPTDREASLWEYMFLPDWMMWVYEHASITEEDATGNLTEATTAVLDGKGLPDYRFPNYPFWVFMLLLAGIVALTLATERKKVNPFWIKLTDRVLFITMGLLGALIAFLWFGADHNVTVWNLNILWAHPLHLLFILIPFSIGTRIQRYYLALSGALIVITLIAWPFLPQVLPWHAYPLAATLAYRHFMLIKEAERISIQSQHR